MKKIVFVLLAVSVWCFMAYAGGTGESNEFILGVQQPLTGDNAIAGQAAMDSIQMFVDQKNKEGGFLGKQIKIVSYDDQGSSEEAVKVANKIIEIDKATVLMGSLISSCVLASGRYINEAQIPTFGLGLSPTWMSQGWEYYFRACMNTDRAIPSLINDMIKMGIKSAAVFKGEDDSSNTGSTTFIKECEKAGIKITIVTSFSSGDTDFSGQIAAMLNTRPDCIYMSTLNYMLGTFMKQVRGFGYNGLVLGKELFTTDQLGVARELANNYIFFAPYVTYPSIEACKEEPMKSFMIQYQKTYGRLPVHDCAFRAWDSMLALDAAINIAKSLNNEAIRNAVPKVKGVPGLGGILDFSSGDGEGLPSVKTYIIQNMNYLPLQSWIDQGDYDKLKAESGKK